VRPLEPSECLVFVPKPVDYLPEGQQLNFAVPVKYAVDLLKSREEAAKELVTEFLSEEDDVTH